jgi:hypothetical protein
MDVNKILNESTHFRVSSHGISFAVSVTCDNCGAVAFNEWTPWMQFNGVSLDECRLEAVETYGMQEVPQDYNELYYSEDTPSNDACGNCS